MKTFSFLILFTFLMNITYAQYSNCERWSLGANFTITNPIEEMKDNGFRINYGATFNVLYKLNPRASKVNFHIGARMTGGAAIGERDNLTLEDPLGASARSSVYNTLLDFHFLGRIVLNPYKKIQPYFDIFGGARLVGANQDIRLTRRISDYDRKTSDRIVQSGNGAWGTGVGALVRLNRNVFFDIGTNWTQSETQKFVDMNTVSIDNDVVQYDVVSSFSNSVGVHIGFHFIFDCTPQSEKSKWKNTKDSNNSQAKRKVKKKKPRTKKTNKPSNQKN